MNIHKDAESDYGASFPDLPGCATIPERPLSIIDTSAQTHNQSRSAFIVAALLEKCRHNSTIQQLNGLG